MSRGGRGGSRGGGRTKAGTARIGGIEIAYDEGIEENVKRPKPVPLFPEYHPPRPAPLTPSELSAVEYQLNVRSRMRNGPLYTTLPASAPGLSKRKSMPSTSPSLNPFEGMESYSQQYFTQPRALPNLRVHWRIEKKRRLRGEGLCGKEGFPRELWGVLGIVDKDTKDEEEESGEKDGERKGKEKEKGKAKARGKGKGKEKEVHRKGRAFLVGEEGNNDDGDGNDEDEDEEKVEKEDGDLEEEADEEVDDAYDTDEEDMGGDYNAEQYFDDGGDEGDEDDGGGGGGGGDYYD